MNAIGGSLRRAAKKARRNPDRVVYAIRDTRGRMNELLTMKIKGKLCFLMAAAKDGGLTLVRHP